MDADQRRQRWLQLTQSLPLRFALVATMTLVLLLPLELVDSVVDERAARYQGVLSEIADIWGHTQTLIGPLLVVPYEYEVTQQIPYEKKDGTIEEREKVTAHQDWAVFLPDAVDVTTTIDPQYRQRGIYRSLVYKAAVDLRGQFATPDFSRFANTPTRIDWQGAFLSLGLSDTRAIDDSAALEWAGQQIGFSPGTRYDELLCSGLHAELDGQPISESKNFSIALQLRGSEGFYFTPVGRQTTARFDSTWPDPSFRGAILPTRHEIGEQGFEADWNIPHLARSYPQSWARGQDPPECQVLKDSRAGVQLFEPVDFYRTSERAIKYAVLFIGLTFLAFFLFEHTLGVRLSVIQYALVGSALALFYLLLISLAEHIGFLGAYLLASVGVVSMVAMYAKAALRSITKGLAVGSILTAIYGLLYVLLQQQDYALLLGTLLLFAVLALTMYLTRHLSRVSTAVAGPSTTAP
nr:inner membrane protein CreD-like [Nerophis lumbriciformis]